MGMTNTTLNDRAVIRLSGPDVRGFLQGLVTNDVLGQLPVYAGLLTPQGKALFDFLIWDEGEDLLLDCEAEASADLVRRLSMYRLRRPLTIAVDPGRFVNWVAEGDCGTPDPRHPGLGRRWLSDVAEGDTTAAWHARRRSLGVAEGRAELGSDKTLWLETNAAELNGVSFTKGCYVGQENTARMNYRQKVNRRLFFLPDGRVERRAVADPGNVLIPGWLKDAISA